MVYGEYSGNTSKLFYWVLEFFSHIKTSKNVRNIPKRSLNHRRNSSVVAYVYLAFASIVPLFIQFDIAWDKSEKAHDKKQNISIVIIKDKRCLLFLSRP